MLKRWFVRCLALSSLIVGSQLPVSVAQEQTEAEPTKIISFAKQVRPVLQAKCFGCHQPNNAGGGLDLTTHEHLFAAGDSGQPAIIPGAPEKSPIVAVVS
ncbi:MAG: c-type cytochrome domain-containing protein, partial [Pirellulaceae bacterium]|nr:c-type cytochrome domain-containing protein [Pirellulaceae bacterium]